MLQRPCDVDADACRRQRRLPLEVERDSIALEPPRQKGPRAAFGGDAAEKSALPINGAGGQPQRLMRCRSPLTAKRREHHFRILVEPDSRKGSRRQDVIDYVSELDERLLNDRVVWWLLPVIEK